MASKNTRHTLSLNLVGNLKSKLEAISKAAKEVEEDMNKGIGSAAKYAAAWEVTKTVVSKTTEVIREGVQAFVEIEAAQGRLADSLKRVNAGAGAFRRAQNLANIAAKKYGIQIEKSLDSIRRLTDSTGDATAGLNDYSLAVNIAQKENKDLAEITELLSNANKGEVGELKKLKGVTQETVTVLSKMADESKRTAEIKRILTKEYEGAAEATRGTSDAMKANEEKMRLLKASAADVAVSFGKVVGVLSYNDEITWFDKFADGMRNWSKAMRTITEDTKDYLDSIMELSASDVWQGMKAAAVDPTESFWVKAMDIKATRTARRGTPGNRPVNTNRAGSWESGPMVDRWTPEGLKGQFSQIANITDEMLDAEVKKRGGRTQNLVEYGNQAENWQDEELPTVGRGFGKALAWSDKDSKAQAGVHDAWKREQDKLNHEAKIRDEIVKLQLEGNELEAERIRILNDEDLTPLERKLELKKLDNEATREAYAAAKLGADTFEGIAGMFIESEASKAGIRAVMETAEGIAKLALGPFGAMEAAAHFAAAAQFGIAAAMGGKSAPGGKKGAAMGGASSSANRERLDREERQPKMTNINLDFSRSVGVGPKAGRELAYEINRGLSSTGGNGRLF